MQRVKRRYDAFIAGGGLLEDFETERKEHKKRSDTLDDAIMADLQQLVDQDPGRTMRSMAKELGCPLPSTSSKLNLPGSWLTSCWRSATMASSRVSLFLLWSFLLVSKSSGRPLFYDFWAPSCPDCNPLDYYVWGVCEWDANRAPHSTAASLMVKIMELMGNLLRATVAKACKRFRPRIEAVVKAGGDFFE